MNVTANIKIQNLKYNTSLIIVIGVIENGRIKHENGEEA